MNPSVHLVPGPLGHERTARLLADYRRVAAQPGRALWLSPSVRAVAEVIAQLAAAGRPVLQPNIFTIAGFAAAVLERAIPPRRPTAPWDRRLVLAEVAADLGREGGSSFFRRVAETRGFIDGAEGLLDEVESHGIASDQLRAFDGGPRSAKLAACAEMYGAVATRTGDERSPIARAAAVIAGGLPSPFNGVRSVFIDGFTSFTPVEWQLVEALARCADLWVALPGDSGERLDAFAAVDETRRRLITLGAEGGAAVSHQEKPSDPIADRPAGLAHLDGRLFGPSTPPSTDAAGLHLIEAPGPLGEARLVARRIRSLLASGVRPEAIVVTARELTHSFDLLGEVFAEYGLPVELDGEEAILRNPAVGVLLRALRLPDDGWPFAGVTALLRSNYFRPVWPEAEGEKARHAEGLLRLLGEPRGREAYLRAVRLWAETPPEGLEDEQAEESRRLRKARLAADCRPFLERFFQAWDGLPAKGQPAEFVSAVHEFARNIGLEAVAAADPIDSAALESLWAVLAKWDGPPVARGVFLRRLTVVAASAELPRSPGMTGCVRIVPAEEARHLSCDHMFVLGLGERNFPRLGPPPSLLDDADRQILRDAGLPFPDPAGRLGTEQLLFLQLIARPRQELVLSYPAVDDRGQPLLPGSFLRAVRDCFAENAIPVERSRMVIEGYLTRDPLSPAEARTRFAAQMRGRDAQPDHPDLSAELCEHLRWAEQLAAARFRSKDYNRYDGWVDSPTALAAVRERFGPEKVFSPTALEAYVSCPFRFLVEHVLRLEELDEPGEEVEHTRRGAAYHRALSRLHAKLRDADPQMTHAQLPDTIGPALLTEIDKAVEEYAKRAPSPASRKLWELEGRRLHRSVTKYRGHWESFLEPWRKAGANLDPRHLEADFGLPTPTGAAGLEPLVISVGGVEVRIGGRIDRVDVTELEDGLGFWVIDYKTGRASNHTAADLARFEKLQLPLYALAVERVFFPGQMVRPLGLAYWLVTDTGPKPVLPGTKQALGWLADPKKWTTFRQQLEQWVAKLVGRIREGQFPLAPRSDNCTDRCSFGRVCRISQSRNVGKEWNLSLPGGDEEK